MIVRVANRTLALPVEHVVEAMRPLPITPADGVPDGDAHALLGTAQIRGTPSRVIDLGRLLGLAPPTPDAAGHAGGATRFVAVRGEPTALRVDAVLGVQTIDRGEPVRIFAGRSTLPSNMLTGEALPGTRSRDQLTEPLRDLLAAAVWLSPQEGDASSPEAR